MAAAAKADEIAAQATTAAEVKRAKEEGFWPQYFKPLAVPIVLAILAAYLAFYSGQITERNKQHDQDDRLAVENRRRLFVTTAQDFGIYITHWSRLRTVASIQDQLTELIEKKEAAIRALRATKRTASTEALINLTTDVRKLNKEMKLVDERKERYVKGRDDAKDRLYGNFEQARLFFGRDTTAAIAEYEGFERDNSGKKLPELPSVDEWRRLASGVFEHMRTEIRNDEQRLQSPSGGNVASR